MITECNIRQAMKYCKDDYRKIPGYERAIKETEKFEIHHVLEMTLDGQYAHSKEELIRLDMYFNRPYFELLWMNQSEHRSLHTIYKHPQRGKTGDKASGWKGDNVGPQGAYLRAKKLYRDGKITEEEFQPYRDEWIKYKMARKKQTSSQSSGNH